MADKSHRICQHYRSEIFQIAGKVGSSVTKQLIGGIHLRSGQTIEQRRLAGSGVANSDTAGISARRRPRRACSRWLRTVSRRCRICRMRDGRRSVSSCVFTRTRRPIPPFCRSGGSKPHQPRAHMIKLRQFDLQLAFIRCVHAGQKLSRIRPVRSSTRHSKARSKVCAPG